MSFWEYRNASWGDGLELYKSARHRTIQRVLGPRHTRAPIPQLHRECQAQIFTNNARSKALQRVPTPKLYKECHVHDSRLKTIQKCHIYDSWPRALQRVSCLRFPAETLQRVPWLRFMSESWHHIASYKLSEWITGLTVGIGLSRMDSMYMWWDTHTSYQGWLMR